MYVIRGAPATPRGPSSKREFSRVPQSLEGCRGLGRIHDGGMSVYKDMGPDPFKPMPGPKPDRRVVLVKYEEVDASADTSAPQVGLFACEVAELVFAVNLGPVMLRELRVGNTLYGNLVPPGRAGKATFEVLLQAEQHEHRVDESEIEFRIRCAAGYKVGYDVVALLREDADGQRWTAQAGVESSFRDGYVDGKDGPWALSRETYLYVCDKWGWDLVSDDLASDPDDVGEADVEGDGGEDDPDDVMAPRSEVMAHVERSRECFSLQLVSQQGGSLKEYALITRRRANDFDRGNGFRRVLDDGHVSQRGQVAEGDGPDILLLDVSDEDRQRGEYGWRTVKELCDFLGDVVWSDLTAFQLDRGWSIEDVMYSVGIPGPWGEPAWDELLDDADERRLEREYPHEYHNEPPPHDGRPWSGDPAEC